MAQFDGLWLLDNLSIAFYAIKSIPASKIFCMTKSHVFYKYVIFAKNGYQRISFYDSIYKVIG